MKLLNFVCYHMQIGCGIHPASCSLGNGDSVPAVKWLEHENDHLSPLITVVENV